MRIVVDYVKCTGLGMCEAEAPDLFEVQNDGSLKVLNDQPGSDQLAAAQAAAGQVVLLDGDAVPYTRLILATGGDPRMLPGGENLEGVHVLRTLDDAIAIRAALDAGARTVVIGAGFIGSEVASAARKRGLT